MKYIPPKINKGEFAMCNIIVNQNHSFRMVTDGDMDNVLKRVQKKGIKNVSSVKVEALRVWKKVERK